MLHRSLSTCFQPGARELEVNSPISYPSPDTSISISMSMRALILSVSAILATGSSPCTAFSLCNEHHRAYRATSSSPSYSFRIFSLSATSSSSGSGGGDESTASSVNTITTHYETTLAADRGIKYTSRLSRLRKIFRNNNNNADHYNNESKRYSFTYDCDEMILGDSDDTAINNKPSTKTTTAVMLIHPIGVGIGRWYHDRLLASLQERYNDIDDHRLVFVSPDLLGSATASGPVDATTANNGEAIQKFPLLNITDWTDQVTQLMADYEAKGEKEGHPISSWSIVANGGCAPIALQVASASAIQNNNSSPFKAALTNVIISSPPRLPFFLESTDPTKVQKSYRTLSGITGRLFWWYALRKNGTFIQQFSERNLVGDASKLGEQWTPNCVKSAKLHGGQSRYSTFAFLAGALQDGCVDSLTTLKQESDITIDILRGTDKRRNRAKSWFWSSSRKKQTAASSNSSSSAKEEDGSGIDTTKQTNNATMPTTASTTPKEEEESIQQYYYASKTNNNNGNKGKEVFIGGRISLAWEDSDGYAKSLMELLTV